MSLLTQELIKRHYHNPALIAGPGLTDVAALDEALRHGHYQPVLEAVWSETDASRRVTWLRDKYNQLHAPLLFELALAEYAVAPTPETAVDICYPLIAAGSFRTDQDWRCYARTAEENLFHPHENMAKIYVVALQALMGSPVLPDEEKLKLKVREVAGRSLSTPLPPPDWLLPGYYFEGYDLDVIRRDFAQDFLSP